MFRMIGRLALCALLLSGPGMATADQEKAAIQSYLDYVSWELERHKRYPEYAELKRLSGRVLLRFTIRSNGEIVEPAIVEATGHFLFGHVTLQALRRIRRLPTFPPEIQRDELRVEVPINYRIESE